MPYIKNCSPDVERLKREIKDAGAVLIGAGAGLSTSAGFVYEGARFREYFGDFESKYGFHNMYTGGFYPYPTPEEHWAYWSRYIRINRYMDAPKPAYEELLSLVRGKDYFVLTTNVDHQFQKAGFDKARLFYTQGDYGLFQCSLPCCQETFANEEAVRRMAERQRDMRIPADLLPRCPRCGRPMTMNLRSDEGFVQDAGWYKAAQRYENFVNAHRSGHVLYLELGVGYNTPGIIKYPFWRMAGKNPEAFYASINYGEADCPAELKARAACINGDIYETLCAIAG